MATSDKCSEQIRPLASMLFINFLLYLCIRRKHIVFDFIACVSLYTVIIIVDQKKEDSFFCNFLITTVFHNLASSKFLRMKSGNN